jgi:hypothetical protein
MKRLWLLAMALFFFCAFATAQISDKVLKVNIGTVQSDKPLSIQVELMKLVTLDRVEIAYRPFGLQDFKRSEMSIANDIASIAIPSAELIPPYLEYYIILYVKGKIEPETYPMENAAQHPLRVTLLGADEAEKQIIVLSPESNERLAPEDVFISFSLLRSDSSVSRAATRLYLDGINVSSNIVISGDLYVLQPENASITLSTGHHTIRVELYDQNGKQTFDYSWEFSVTGKKEAGSRELPAGLMYNGSIQLETHSENIANETTPYNRATISAGGNYGEYCINSHLYVTNEEKENRQPQNRFFIGAESRWLKLGYGDSYPIFPDLIMSGKRVRGFMGNLTLGFFNLNVAKGDIVRRIESEILKTLPDSGSLTSEQQLDPNAAFYYDYTSNPKRWYKLRYGTFNRDIVVIRPSFGSDNKSHLGFTYLKSTDDVNSIRYGIKPEENLVLGSDLLVTIDDRNFEIFGQAAFSATNKDITGGTLTDAQIDAIFSDSTYNVSTKDVRKARDILSRFITVNEHLVPLKLTNLPTLAYEGGISLNYFKNYLKFKYLRHGNDYESFGQTYLRTDVVGYNILDRIRLIDNQLILSGGVEQIKDNTAKTKGTATTFTTVNVAVAYYPRTDFPNMNVAYLRATNSNGVAKDSLFAIDDGTDRILVQSGHEFSLGARHNATIGFSTSVRDDRTSKNLDTRNTTFILNNTTTYQIPLQTVVSLTINSSKFSYTSTAGTISPTTNYTTLYVNAHYRLLEEKLRLSGSVSPTFGDLQRTLLDASAQYFFLKNLNALTQLRIYLNKDGGNATIWNLTLRLDI